MARFETFERDLKLATAGLEPAAINAALAKYAKAELQLAISAGASPQYDRYVNGVAGLPEEAVVAPGSILYVFSNWPLVINAALAELAKRSPRKSGRFAASFIVIVGGQPVTNYASIPSESEVIITDFQPYIRKVEGGLSGVKRRRVFDGTKNAMSNRFRGAFNFETKFLNIASGVHPTIPYVLKGQQRSASTAALATWHGVPKQVIEGWRAQGKRLGTVNMAARLAAQDRRSSAFRAGRETLAGRSDSQAGQPITYPSIIINAL
ncbi:hypothetical protein NKH17_12415 [Mesorhizobium sp. M1334]|uniref:hypothetical protein n=1 Tax=Mesorhizobium sp. M1334 TaxID=2957084 RepID=UPI00333C7008